MKLNKGTVALLVAGFVFAGSRTGLAKDLIQPMFTYELKSTPIAELLEDENIQNLTTIDEELELGNIDIIEKDAQFRKQIMNLEYYESAGEEDLYNETLNWLRNHIEDYSVYILNTSVKGAIAEEENVAINDITLTAAPDYNEDSLFLTPEGVVGIKNDFHIDGYTIKSKQINDAVNLSASIQDMNFEEATSEDIFRLYDEVIDTAKMVIASGASRHDDKIKEKNSKKYIKKKYGI